jgi:hypothetical protein
MTFWAMTGRTHIYPANRSCDIVVPVGMEVCAGGHGMFVMKKVKGPAQAKLGRGTLQSWDGARSPGRPPGKRRTLPLSR